MSSFQITCAVALSVLLIASLVIFILKKWRPGNETFKKVEIIIRSWWLILGSVLLALSWTKWGLILFFYLLTVFAINEYLKVSGAPFKNYLKFGFLILTTVQYLALCFESMHFFQAAVPILCLWMIPILVIGRATIADLPMVFGVIYGLSMMIYYISHIPALAAMSDLLGLSKDQVSFSILFLLITTWGNDVFQFLGGKILGKRKIVPHISPNKTLAGFIAGIVCTTLVCLITTPRLLGLSFSAALALGPILSLAGIFGDLIFSAVKRNMGVKDFSQALPGHGGLLDRLDSLVFTAPLFFHFLYAIKGGP